MKKPNSVGWVSKMGVETEDYAWTVRCPEHPPEQPLGWQEISLTEAMKRLMLSGCEVCDETLV